VELGSALGVGGKKWWRPGERGSGHQRPGIPSRCNELCWEEQRPDSPGTVECTWHRNELLLLRLRSQHAPLKVGSR